MSRSIPLSNLPRELAKYTGQPAPSPRVSYDRVLRGRIPATQRNGRWYIAETDLPVAAEALGMNVPVAA